MANFYQNANEDARRIKDGFLVRTREFEIIKQDLHQSAGERSTQHYLLLGKRGSGKSTLLRRIQAEIELDALLFEKYIAVNLAEEQANIYQLYDLLESVVEELEYRRVPVDRPVFDNDLLAYARALFSSIHKAAQSSGKRVVLLLDNIDRILENVKEDASLLREFLLNYHDIKIIGCSTRMTEHFWRYSQPFYEFFRVLELPPLGKDEIKGLLLKWAQDLDERGLETFVQQREGQLEVIRILTDGLPRTLQFFVQVLIAREQDNAYEYLRSIMDNVTPLYQERLNNLPPSQRKIVLQMAFIWEAAGAGQIAEATKMETRVISAQLKQLIEKGVAEKVETDTKNNLYRLTERFFNLWLIFTQGSPREKRRAKYLTIFLENFYSGAELTEIAFAHLERLGKDGINAGDAMLKTKAYVQSRYISAWLRDSMIAKTMEIIKGKPDLSSHLPPTIKETRDKIGEFCGEGRWDEALNLVDTIEQEDGTREDLRAGIYLRQLQQGVASEGLALEVETLLTVAMDKKAFGAKTHFGLFCLHRKMKEEAVAYLLEGWEEGDPAALVFLASAFLQKEDIQKAEYYGSLYLNNADRDGGFDGLAFSVMGVINMRKGDGGKAVAFFRQALEKGQPGSDLNLGTALMGTREYERAEGYLLKAWKEGSGDAAAFLGDLYQELDKFDLVEQYYLSAIEQGVSANVSLADFYYKKKRDFDAARMQYLAAVEKGNAKAIGNYMTLCYILNKDKSRVKDFLTLFEQGANESDAWKEWAIILRAWVGDLKGLPGAISHWQASTPADDGLVWMELLIHFQSDLVMSFFRTKEQVLEASWPLYYAAGILSGSTDIGRRTPVELQETVREILRRVQVQRDYYYPDPQG